MRINLFLAAGLALGLPAAADTPSHELNRLLDPGTAVPAPQYHSSDAITTLPYPAAPAWPGAHVRPTTPAPPMPGMDMSSHHH